MILDEILAHKATELAARKAHEPESSVAARVAAAPPPLDFRAALHGPDLSVIAEVKRSSPARGALRLDMDAERVAADYAAAGAAAISVLTDERYFRGLDADLVAVRQRVQVPLLRKDFVIDPYQVYEARALGADAVLLIVRALERRQIDELGRVAAGLGMAALVEVHTADELALAADIGATLIGINNRDLTTMTVDLETTARLLPLAPPGATMVSESGIKSPDDVLGSEGSHAPRQAASSDPSRETTDPDPLITADSMQSRRARSMRCFASLIGCEKIVGYALASVAFHSERSEESVPGTKGAARAADPSLRSG